MKKETRKLSLKKETVSILDKTQATNVLGGGNTDSSYEACRTKERTCKLTCHPFGVCGEPDNN